MRACVIMREAFLVSLFILAFNDPYASVAERNIIQIVTAEKGTVRAPLETEMRVSSQTKI